MNTIVGTNHFTGFTAAVNYYKAQGFSSVDVVDKKQAGEIEFGPPKVKNGQKLMVIDGRYHITEQ